MTTKDSQSFFVMGWSGAIAATLQTVGLIRYISRLPEDWVGITIYAITLIAFIAVSIGSFIQARKKDKER
ncbi:MAG TPA: hypothetical protein VLA72_15165 [Anaerolineales bacterium]|nr:hypothetical protein [Anaerolineales bacterium]